MGIHSDYFKDTIRAAVLKAMDEVCSNHGITCAGDQDLPELFKTLDALSAKLFRQCESEVA